MDRAISPSNSARKIYPAVGGVLIGLYVTLCLQLSAKWAFVALVGILLPALAAILGDVRKFLLAGLALTLPVLTFQKKIWIPPDYSFHVTFMFGIGVFDAAVIALYLVWLLRLWSDRNARMELLTRDHLFIGIFFGICVLSAVGAVDLGLSLAEFGKLAKGFLVFFLVSQFIQTREEIQVLIVALLVTILIQCAMMIPQSMGYTLGLQHFYGLPGFLQMEFHGKTYLRPGGTLGHPNNFSLFIGQVIPFALCFLLRHNLGNRLRAFCWMVFFLGVVGLILSFSRSGWLNISVSTLTVFVLSFAFVRGSRPMILRTGLIFGVILLAVLCYYYVPIRDRLFHSAPILVTGRWDMNRDALNVWKDFPWLGVGVNNYMRVVINYQITPYSMPAHCVYFLYLAETGLLGLCAFVMLIVHFLRKAFRLIKTVDPLYSSMGIAFVASMLGMLADECFSFALRIDHNFYLFWLLMGLMEAVRRVDGRTKEERIALKHLPNRSR